MKNCMRSNETVTTDDPRVIGCGRSGPAYSTLRRTSIKVVATAASIWAGSLPALAAEGQVFGGPTGGTDIRNAYTPPQSGFYGSLVGIWGNAGGVYDDKGKTVNIHSVANVGIGAAAVLYVYPFQLLGGTLDSAVQQAVSYGEGSIGRRNGYTSGLNDTFVELLGWSRYIGPLFGTGGGPPDPFARKLPYGLTVKAAYSMIFPTGNYERRFLFPQGHNDFFLIPNLAMTYLTQPNLIGDGIELDAHVFFDFATRNTKTDYATGLVVDTDFAISNRIGLWQFGLAGFYAQQVQRDKVGTQEVQPNGKRLVVVDLGPVVAYDIPKWRSTIKLKYQAPVIVHNTLALSRLVLSYSMQF